MPLPRAARRRGGESGRGRRARAVLRRSPDRGTHVRVYVARAGRDLAIFVARPLTEVDHALATLRWALGGVALAGIALAVLLSWLATRTAVASGRGADDDRRARRQHPRPVAPDRGARRRRGLTARALLQHDARGARALAEGAAPARRRRLARAANPADVAAHEHGGARARRPARPGDRERLRNDVVSSSRS